MGDRGSPAESVEPREGRPSKRSSGWLQRLEWAFLGVGTALVLFFAGARFHGAVSQRLDLAAFDAAAGGAGPVPEWRVDQVLWSEGRIAKFQESLRESFAAPLAVLRIPKIDLEVPVLPGTDELTLNRAVGAIAGTAIPGQPGNVGIAGHRDGFFRGLKDLEVGDGIELETLAGNQSYRVAEIRIVDPTEVSVLAATPEPALTLVTCYPFYFIGSAPQRYIIRAEVLPANGDVEASLHR
jgi:sortase A